MNYVRSPNREPRWGEGNLGDASGDYVIAFLPRHFINIHLHWRRILVQLTFVQQ